MKCTKRLSLALVSLAAGLWAGSGNATAVDALEIGDTEDVICNGTCKGVFGNPARLSLRKATAYKKPDSEAAELALLNEMLDDVSAPNVRYVNRVEESGDQFTTTRQYFSIGTSTKIWYFANMSGGPLTVKWEPESYSHWTEYGEVATPAPVPAAVWLFGSALIVIIGLARCSAAV